MTFTYNPAAPGAIDYVRLYIQDTVAAQAQFSDEELQIFLAGQGGDTRMAAADALDAWANLLTRSAIRWNVNGMGVDRTMIPDQLRALAKQLRDAAIAIPYEFESVVDHDTSPYGEDRSNYPFTPGDPGETPIP